MKIYDCFTFFNELDLLEIRLQELYNSVDYFIIAEATQTFSGANKELIFEKNKERYKKYLDKIIYVPVELPKLNFIDKIIIKLMDSKHLPRFGTNSLGLNGLATILGMGRWKYVFKQREAIKEGLKNTKDEDIIMLSDLDEIPNKEYIPKLKNLLIKQDYVYFNHKMFFYYLNGLARQDKWIGTRVCNYKTLKKKLLGRIQFLRNEPLKEKLSNSLGFKRNIQLVEDGGWHFTYLGEIDKIYLKTKSVAEAINIEKTKESLLRDIEEGIFRYSKDSSVKIDYVPVDKKFPEAILQNKKKYNYLIKNINL